MEIIQVFFVDLPSSIKGLTIKNNDDSFTILINVNMSYEAQLAAYLHEMEHINNNDFDYMHDINALEWCRHSA